MPEGTEGEFTEDAPKFFANNDSIAVPVKTGEESSMTDASASFTAGNYTIEPFEFTVGEDGKINVGIQGTANYQWVIFDNFQLTYYGVGTDGIENINTNEQNKLNGTIYNLQGQKVMKATKGLYIINGKKVVIK